MACWRSSNIRSLIAVAQKVSSLRGRRPAPERPGGAGDVDGSSGGLPPGDEFEGSGHVAEDEAESEKPDVNIAPTAYEPEEAIEGAQLGHRFSAIANNAGAREGVQHLSAEK